jgi:hypothetical protein
VAVESQAFAGHPEVSGIPRTDDLLQEEVAHQIAGDAVSLRGEVEHAHLSRASAAMRTQAHDA